MKKLILFISLFFLLWWINQSFSAWYGFNQVTASWECPNDWDTTWWKFEFNVWTNLNWWSVCGTTVSNWKYLCDHAVDRNNDWQITTTDYTSTTSTQKASGVLSWNKMNCAKWDAQNPTAWYSISWWTTTNNTWSNSNVTVSATCIDTWWSWCDNSSYQYRESDSNFTCNSSWVWNTATSKTYSPLNDTNLVKYICFRVKDIAGNWFVYSNVATVKIDKKSPKIIDITNNIPSDLLANNNYNYDFTISSDSGSPIVRVEWTKENFDNENTTSFIDTDNSSWLQYWDISNVDNYRQSNWSREYSFTITKICDEAGNCSTPNHSYNHNVYANTESISENIDSISLRSWEIADGKARPLTINLEDNYWNDIIPANWINRTVDFYFDVDNTTDLDQYSKTWWDAIFLDTPNDNNNFINRLTSSSNFNSQTSSDWDYTFDFKVYAPTGSWYYFDINSITYDINQNNFDDKLNQPISNSNISFNFAPLFTTDFIWEQNDNWFKIGQVQTWSLNITKENTSIITSNPNTYLEFWQYNNPDHDTHPNLDLSYDNWTIISEWNKSTVYSNTLFSSSIPNNQFITYMTQSWSVDNTPVYLSSHVSYTIDWKDIVLNTDVIWMDHYYWTADLDYSVSFDWIKIVWNTNSKYSDEIIEGEEWKNYSLVWNLDKAYMQQFIRKNAYSVINTVTPDNWSNSITNLDLSNNEFWVELWENILYFWKLWWANVTIDSLINYSWKKTLLIHGWNLYIRNNIVAYNLSRDILGIIVIQDQEGNGWKIYVHPDVTRLDAVMYADKALLSYDGSELSPLNWGTSSYLGNQLFINWSIFSNNTLWGSVNNICPYFIADSDCDSNTSQYYDLNYLRRWYANKYDSSYDDYPIIIEYNPLIQNSPPPLFLNKK